MDRLDKILVSQNVGSRKEVQKLIKDGAVCVNGECIKQPQHKVDAVADDITVGGQPLLYSKYVYIMMNKPAGVLSASNDKRAETVIDLLPEEFFIFNKNRTVLRQYFYLTRKKQSDILRLEETNYKGLLLWNLLFLQLLFVRLSLLYV